MENNRATSMKKIAYVLLLVSGMLNANVLFSQTHDESIADDFALSITHDIERYLVKFEAYTFKSSFNKLIVKNYPKKIGDLVWRRSVLFNDSLHVYLDGDKDRGYAILIRMVAVTNIERVSGVNKGYQNAGDLIHELRIPFYIYFRNDCYDIGCDLDNMSWNVISHKIATSSSFNELDDQLLSATVMDIRENIDSNAPNLISSFINEKSNCFSAIENEAFSNNPGYFEKVVSKKIDYYVSTREEEKAWQKASSEASISSYDSYLDSYSHGKYTQTARIAIAKLDKQAYEKAINNGTQNALQYYLKAYPNGEFRSKVNTRLKEKIEDDVYLNAKSENTIKAYTAYHQKYPRGKYSSEVNRILENGYYTTGNKHYKDKDWYKAKEYFDLYIDRYPNGEYASEVTQCIHKCTYKIKLNLAHDKIGYVKIALTNPTGTFGNDPSLETPVLDPFYGKEGMGAKNGYNFGMGILTSNCRPGFYMSFLLGLDASINSFDWSGLGQAWANNSSWTNIMSFDIITGAGFHYNFSDELILDATIAGGLPIIAIYPTLTYESPEQEYNFIIFPDKKINTPISENDDYETNHAYTIPITISFGVRRGKVKLSYETRHQTIKSDYYIKYESTSKDLDEGNPLIFSSNFKWMTQRIALHYYF